MTWPAVSPRTTGIALAVLASAAAASVICALLPEELASSPTAAPARQTAQASAATQAPAPAQHVARAAGAAFNVGKVWNEEQRLLSAAVDPGIRGTSARAWAPAREVSPLLATQFKFAAHTATSHAPAAANPRTAETKAAVPMPPPAPVARSDTGKHQAMARKGPMSLTPQVASLPPQAPEHGYFGFFRKLFGNPDHAAKAMLAANPKTAIYDIEKHVVYLPSGAKLEAHSGYGQWLDDPSSVKRKNRGVTPPNVYAVSFREKLFHGVRALRMTPVGGGNMYGRDGILAHSYMLGADGQSNGCVSVKDYKKFLQAYKNGEFEKIIVVRSVDDAKPPQVASAQPGSV